MDEDSDNPSWPAPLHPPRPAASGRSGGVRPVFRRRASPRAAAHPSRSHASPAPAPPPATPRGERPPSEERNAGPAAWPTDRRLAALAFLDVADYARLMGADEAETLRRWVDQRGRTIEPLVARWRGRVVDRAGDGLFVEFRSVLDAVRWAFDVQGALAVAPAAAEEPALPVRVAVHLGDCARRGGWRRLRRRRQRRGPAPGACRARRRRGLARGARAGAAPARLRGGRPRAARAEEHRHGPSTLSGSAKPLRRSAATRLSPPPRLPSRPPCRRPRRWRACSAPLPPFPPSRGRPAPRRAGPSCPPPSCSPAWRSDSPSPGLDGGASEPASSRRPLSSPPPPPPPRRGTGDRPARPPPAGCWPARGR